MNSDSYINQLNIETFKDDVSIEFCIFQVGKEPESCTSVPERLVSRFIHLGHAYNLHISQLVNIYEDVVFNAAQCENLTIEMQFIAGILDDPALFQGFEPVLYLLAAIKKDPNTI